MSEDNIVDIPQITEHLANNIVNWYSENKIDLMDFFGRMIKALIGDLLALVIKDK